MPTAHWLAPCRKAWGCCAPVHTHTHTHTQTSTHGNTDGSCEVRVHACYEPHMSYASGSARHLMHARVRHTCTTFRRRHAQLGSANAWSNGHVTQLTMAYMSLSPARPDRSPEKSLLSIWISFMFWKDLHTHTRTCNTSHTCTQRGVERSSGQPAVPSGQPAVPACTPVCVCGCAWVCLPCPHLYIFGIVPSILLCVTLRRYREGSWTSSGGSVPVICDTHTYTHSHQQACLAAPKGPHTA